MSERDAAGNRRLSRYSGDDSGHAERMAAQLAMGDDDQGDDDRPDHVAADSDSGAVDGGETTCTECEATAAYEDPREALGHDGLPRRPLCREHILERT